MSWKTLSSKKDLSDNRTTVFYGVLQFSDSQRHKIESVYSTEGQKRIAAVQLWLASDPYASWRRLITRLDMFEEHAVAKQIHRYAEMLTGMIIYTLQN